MANRFNPRPRKGATLDGRTYSVGAPVSIHAPVRERRQPAALNARITSFQSTPP